MRTQGFGALVLQPVGPSGQLGKEQTLPDAEDLFSRYGVRLGQSDSAPHARTCSVGAELLEYVQEQDGGTTETVSEAPGAYGGCGGSHAAGAAPYETVSTLAPWPSPEVGVAERHAVGPSHSSLPPNLRPVILVRTDNTAKSFTPPSIPSWDLSLVLTALQQGLFEPLQTVEPKFLSMKTLLLLALASIKRVGDLHAFSVDDSCLQFGPADSQIILRARPGCVPKVPTTPFRDQVVSLQALPPEEADPALALLCPVRALRYYVDSTQSFRTSDQLFVCHGGRQKGNAISKQRMAHWIVDAITLAYQAQGVPCPFRLRAHSTKSLASSRALARGASLTDICRAAGWATPNTFARFYSLRVEPVSSCVLTLNG